MKQQNGKNKLKYKSKTSGLAKAVLCAVSGAVVSVAAGALLFPEKMVGLVSNAFIGPKIDAENIDFEKNRLVLTNVKVLGDDGIEMINSPKIVIDYSLKDRKITNLKSFGGHLNIVAYNDDYDLNVVNEFVKKKSKKIEKLEDYKVGIDTVIDRIEAEDMTVSFIDQSYKEEIKIDAHDVNGTVTFSKTEGIAVDVKGLRKQKKKKKKKKNLKWV